MNCCHNLLSSLIYSPYIEFECNISSKVPPCYSGLVAHVRPNSNVASSLKLTCMTHISSLTWSTSVGQCVSCKRWSSLAWKRTQTLVSLKSIPRKTDLGRENEYGHGLMVKEESVTGIWWPQIFTVENICESGHSFKWNESVNKYWSWTDINRQACVGLAVRSYMYFCSHVD